MLCVLISRVSQYMQIYLTKFKQVRTWNCFNKDMPTLGEVYCLWAFRAQKSVKFKKQISLFYKELVYFCAFIYFVFLRISFCLCEVGGMRISLKTKMEEITIILIDDSCGKNKERN